VRRATALIPLLLVLVAGCGDDDDTATVATAEPLTKAEYIAQADAICEDFRSKTLPLDKESDRAANNLNFARAARAQRETMEILAEGYQRIDALQAPPGDDNAISEIAEARNQFLVLEERYIDALEAGDAARIETLAGEIDSATERRDAILTAYGFKVCGQG
jgi:hypothetical protein